jgi:quinol monooxygenase YgiN
VIIVTGSLTAKPETLDEVIRLSLEHVRRSRAEAGCLLHSVHQDVENPLRVVFVEHWADRGALAAHFAVPASLKFVTDVTALAASRPTIEIYEATPAHLDGGDA